MRKKILSMFLALIMVLSMFPVTTLTVGAEDSTFAGGTGTADKPYLISTADQLAQLAADVNGGNTYSNKYFKLTANINLNGGSSNPWTPIGNNKTPFSGIFDGDKHTISGLYINTVNDYQGLFGNVTNGTISNLNVEGNITAGAYVGGVVGALLPTTSGRVENCSFTGNINESGTANANTDVGGIIGYNHGGEVISCCNKGTITIHTQYIGGVVGRNEGENALIQNCYNEGTVSLSGASAAYAGGIAGINIFKGQILDCYNNGSVDGTDSKGLIGGIAGVNSNGTIERCYNKAEIKGSNSVGGIAGHNTSSSAKIKECYNAAVVTGSSYVGGITGQNDEKATITNCYNDGAVTGTGTGYVGGIVGRNTTTDGSKAAVVTVGTVMNSYNKGTVTGSSYTGDVIGSNTATVTSTKATKEGTVTNCYYKTNSTNGGINGSDAAGQAEGKTAEVFKSGEIAWRLYHGTDGAVWGQEIVKNPKDDYPLLMTTEIGAHSPKVLKVTFKTNTNDSYKIAYTNNGGTVAEPDKNPEVEDANHVFYEWRIGNENGEKYNAKITANDDITVVAVQREKFGGEDASGTVINAIYGVEITQNLGSWMGYATGSTSTEDKFDYAITSNSGLKNPKISGGILTVPAGTDVGEYTLVITASEKEPQISLLSIGGYDTETVTLTVTINIEQATPAISVTAGKIEYGQKLKDSILTTSATHPTTDVEVIGTFAWEDGDIAPTIAEAATKGYTVTFTPSDTKNYKSVTTTVTLEVTKAEPKLNVELRGITGIYNGKAQNLVEATDGTDITAANVVTGGTLKYWLEEDLAEGAEPVYSSTIPLRANADTYHIFYKLVGDDNHSDTDPKELTAVINPFELYLTPGSFTYNGKNTFRIDIAGVQAADEESNRTVIATLTTSGKDAKIYSYKTQDVTENYYTVVLSSPNYTVGNAEALTIKPLTAELKWSKDLTFTFDSNSHDVKATVNNKVEGDTDEDFTLKYKNDGSYTNEATTAGDYIAEVTDLGNPNYALPDESNRQQAWHITPADVNVKLTADKQTLTYGDDLNLTLTIDSPTPFTGTVEFSINGGEPTSVTVDGNKAILPVKAISASNFSAGYVPIAAEFSNNNLAETEKDAITIYVNPKELTATIEGTKDKIYNGNRIATGLNITLSGKVDDNDDVTAAAEIYTYSEANVGTWDITANNVTLSGTQSINYTLPSEIKTSGTITPKTIQLEWRGVAERAYNGDPSNVTATAIELIPDFGCDVQVKNGNQTAVGKYIATAKLLNRNYALLTADGELTDTATQEYIITRAALYIPALTVKYDGTKDFSMELDGVTPTDKPTEKVIVNLTAAGADAGEYTYEIGEKTYTASIDNKNYTIAGGAILTIEKADPKYTAPAAKNLTYTGQSQDLITEGKAEGGELLYSFAQDGVYDTKLPQGINAGSYTVWYMVVGDANHNSTEPESITVTIRKANPIIAPLPAAKTNLKYNLHAQVLITKGNAEGGELLYSLRQDGPYSAAVPTGTNAGTYTVWYKVVGDMNHHDTEPASVKVTIAKADPDYTIPTGLTAAPGDTLADVQLPDGFTWNNPGTSVGNVGEHKFVATYTPKDTHNYNTVSVSLTVTVIDSSTGNDGPTVDDPTVDDPTIEGSDDFRCKMCPKYEMMKDDPIVGVFYRIVHFFVHMAHHIGHLT